MERPAPRPSICPIYVGYRLMTELTRPLNTAGEVALYAATSAERVKKLAADLSAKGVAPEIVRERGRKEAARMRNRANHEFRRSSRNAEEKMERRRRQRAADEMEWFGVFISDFMRGEPIFPISPDIPMLILENPHAAA